MGGAWTSAKFQRPRPIPDPSGWNPKGWAWEVPVLISHSDPGLGGAVMSHSFTKVKTLLWRETVHRQRTVETGRMPASRCRAVAR